jgi:hypothetical protein
MPVHLRLSKTVDMNTRRFKPDWEMNASTLLQASSSRHPFDIHGEPSAGVVKPDHHRTCRMWATNVRIIHR